VTDDPAVIVRRAVMVAPEIEALQTDDTLTVTRREVRRGAADPSQSDDGGVEVLHGSPP
jgi:hypothetical protein